MRPKSNPVRSEAYRRLVAQLPCIMCGIEGFSQCAHGPTLGRGIKCSDLNTFPLCCDRPRVPGCHGQYDWQNTHSFSKGLRLAWAEKWSAATLKAIVESGHMPVKLAGLI